MIININRDEHYLIQEEISIDILLMLCINFILENLKKNINYLKKRMIDIINENQSFGEKKSIDIDKFSKLFSEIQKNMEYENSKILNTLLNKTLKYFNNFDDIDIYMRSFLNFREVLKSIDNENFDLKILMRKQFFEFISPIIEDKLKYLDESLENETWSNTIFNENSDKNIMNLQKLQNRIDIIFYKNFEDYKKVMNVDLFNQIITSQNSNISLSFFKKNQNEDKNSETNNNSNNNNHTSGENNTSEKIINTGNTQQNIDTKNTIEIRDEKFKIMNSSIVLINSIFELFKLILICDDSLMPHICDMMCSQIRKFLDYNREMVLNGEGVRKGKLKAIYQKEISIVCSNALIIERLVKLFWSNQLLKPIFSEITDLIQNIHITCKKKISELFQFL